MQFELVQCNERTIKEQRTSPTNFSAEKAPSQANTPI